MTDDLLGRLRDHQRRYSPYTRQFSDIQLVYTEQYDYKREAEKRERQLKGWSVAKKKALIDGDKQKLIELSKSRKDVEVGR